MRKLDNKEIKEFCDLASLSLEDAKEVSDIFYKMKYDGHVCFEYNKLDCVLDYYNHWKSNWEVYENWDSLLFSEAECGIFGNTPDECKNKIGKIIYQLSSGMYIKFIFTTNMVCYS